MRLWGFKYPLEVLLQLHQLVLEDFSLFPPLPQPLATAEAEPGLVFDVNVTPWHFVSVCTKHSVSGVPML